MLPIADDWITFYDQHYPKGTQGKILFKPAQSLEKWQDAILSAMLGLADETRHMVIYRFNNQYEINRFPAFWNAKNSFDCMPYMNYDRVASIALQNMLLQNKGDKIIILPAFPKDWDVDFRLYAPENTVVEVSCKKGKGNKLLVTPAPR